MSKQLRIRNDGRRRVIIGPPPKSSGDTRKMLKFDTKDDDGVEKGRRLGRTRVVNGDHADALRASRVLKEMGERVGLKLA